MAIDPRLLQPGILKFIQKEEKEMTAQRKTTGNTNKDLDKFILTGKVFWASVRKPNELSGKYQMDLSVDDETAEMLEEKGVIVKEEENEDQKGTQNDRGRYVTLKQGTERKDGTKMHKPLVIDGKRNPVPEDVKIGNGSIVNVETSVFDWKFKGKTGKSLNLGPIQLKTLVKFENKSLDRFPETDYVYEGGTTTANTNDNFEDFTDDDTPFE